jgi:hypothetical protein
MISKRPFLMIQSIRNSEEKFLLVLYIVLFLMSVLRSFIALIRGSMNSEEMDLRAS